MSKQFTPSVDISIIVTSHSEGIILHKTLLSVRRAISELKNASTEVILHLDKPSNETADYVSRSPLLENVRIFTNNFGNPGESRNFCIGQSTGRYITFIDGDDLMSKHWLEDAFAALEQHAYGSRVAHTEMTVEFDGITSVVQKYGEINKETDTLLSVWAGRWNSIIFAPTELLKNMGYPSTPKGYGYEDWLMSCRLIADNIHNILIPETAIFVRRKLTNSTWDFHRSSMAVLPANELLSFESVRKIPETWMPQNQESSPHIKQRLKNRLKGTRFEARSRRVYKMIKDLRNAQSHNEVAAPIDMQPKWLVDEWRAMHVIEKKLFPTTATLQNTPTYHTITPEHYLVGEAYRRVAKSTRHAHYDYLLFVPWLIKGGADLFAINYANTIAKIHPSKNVAVIATLPNTKSTRVDKLSPNVDFIPFGEITVGLRNDCRDRVLEQFVENSKASHIHVFNSELGYEFVNSHSEYIQGSGKKVIVTSFSQSTDDTGRIFGYSHTHVPDTYPLADVFTTDNKAVVDMWIDEYGFDSEKIQLHRQPVNASIDTKNARPSKDTEVRVLWSARLAPEKIPSLVPEIAQLVSKHDIVIDMYGTPDESFDTSFLNHLPKNLTYKGPFSDFYALKPQDYDIFLYTSLFDGMPNALLEASVANLPIVSSAVGGIPEFIDDEKGGALIYDVMNASDYAEKIIAFAQDKDKREKAANHSNNRVKKEFSVEAHEAAVRSMLKTVGY